MRGLELFFVGCACALFVLHASVAGANPSLMCLPTPETTTGAAVSAPGAAGMRVYLDPQTGRLIAPDQVPRQALAAREQAMLRRDGAGLTQQTLPDGAVLVHLQGRFHNMVVARSGPSGPGGGVIATRCVTSAEAARSLPAAHPKRATAPELCRGD